MPRKYIKKKKRFTMSHRERKIRRVMREKGFSQTDLAREIGCSQPAVHYLVRGKMTSARIVKEAVRILDEPIEGLFSIKS
jgi:predicted transcriptional regulator